MMAPLGAVRRDDQTAPFLDAAARGQFLIRKCIECGGSGGPQESTCPNCGSTANEWVAASGGARLISWSVVHGRQPDGSTGPQSIVAIAELDEGPWWWSQVVGDDRVELATGCPLVIMFQPADAGETLPVFRLP